MDVMTRLAVHEIDLHGALGVRGSFVQSGRDSQTKQGSDPIGLRK